MSASKVGLIGHIPCTDAGESGTDTSEVIHGSVAKSDVVGCSNGESNFGIRELNGAEIMPEGPDRSSNGRMGEVSKSINGVKVATGHWFPVIDAKSMGSITESISWASNFIDSDIVAADRSDSGKGSHTIFLEVSPKIGEKALHINEDDESAECETKSGMNHAEDWRTKAVSTAGICNESCSTESHADGNCIGVDTHDNVPSPC